MIAKSTTVVLLSLGSTLLVQSILSAQTKLDGATFAGGCFRCMEHTFEKPEGVLEVIFHPFCGWKITK